MADVAPAEAARLAMYILGISGQRRDAAAALLKDGELIAAIEEEKLARVKHMGMEQAGGLPFKAIEYCLRAAEISWRDVDFVAYYERPRSGGEIDLAFKAKLLIEERERLAFHDVSLLNNQANFARTKGLIAYLSEGEAKTFKVPHHMAHAASAFYASGFEAAAILTADCLGDGTSMQLAAGEGLKIKVIDELRFPHSLGYLYSILTSYLGFKPYSDEHKVECLAVAGEPEFKGTFSKMVRIGRNGLPSFDFSYYDPLSEHAYPFSSRFYRTFGGKPRAGGEPLLDRHANIARSLQDRVEEVILAAVEHLKRKTGSDSLCLAGGLFFNCLVNSAIIERSPFRNVFIQPAAGNAGGALGGALYVWHHVLEKPRRFRMEHAFWGPDSSDDQIKAVLDNCKISYDFLNERELLERVARSLADGMIVGWFQGRAEWGPRALGNRSILADPSSEVMKENLNVYIKHRENFRSFAVSVMEEHAGEFFDPQALSPFMLTYAKIRDDKRTLVPAVLSADGRTRVQLVSRKTNRLFWELLKKFHEIKGLPLLLNTSFNAGGEPLVCMPREAVKTFFSTGIDQLAIGRFFVEK